jgi:hydroxymethylbilane synthase
MEREDPRDVLISNVYPDLDALPAGARIGTSSFRRQCQLHALGRGFVMQDLRGNVGTRLDRLAAGQFDAIILAAAGVIRLGMHTQIRQFLDMRTMLPAIGQGAIGIECRAGDRAVMELIAPLHHEPTAICVGAERAVNRRLFGGCQVPLAGHARLQPDALYLEALVGSPDGAVMVRGQRHGAAEDGEGMGIALAEELLARGAAGILAGFTGAG